jgi:hypothetical protein
MIEAEKEGTQKAKKSKQRKGRLYKKQRKKKIEGRKVALANKRTIISFVSSEPGKFFCSLILHFNYLLTMQTMSDLIHVCSLLLGAWVSD